MSDKDIRSEIEDLKARLESLSRSSVDESGAETKGAEEQDSGSSGGWFSDIFKQAEGLWSGLDLQLKDVPAKTALMIFALGVLTGRLLSKRE
jgi:hypothetical protein